MVCFVFVGPTLAAAEHCSFMFEFIFSQRMLFVSFIEVLKYQFLYFALINKVVSSKFPYL